MKKGVLTVISGFSGAGKGTIVKSLLNKYDHYALSISATSRAPRPGEADGREYFFVTKERFEEMIARGDLIEYTNYVGNYYGTPKSYVMDQLGQGRDIILEIETEGALNIRKQFPDAVLIFVTAPSGAELERRLTGRGSETTEQVRGRLAKAAHECSLMKDYDYILINDDLDTAVEEVNAIIGTHLLRTEYASDIIEKMTEDLAQYKE